MIHNSTHLHFLDCMIGHITYNHGTGTWGFVEFVNTTVRAQAQQTCASIQINSACYWLVVSAPTVPVPSYACWAVAVASMSLLTAGQKPKYNHAIDAWIGQSEAVQPGATAVAATQSAALGVQTQYPYGGYYHGYGYDPSYGMKNATPPSPPLQGPLPSCIKLTVLHARTCF